MLVLRIVTIIIGLLMVLLGCYFVLAGIGVPVEDIGINIWAFELHGKGMTAGIVFCVFGVAVMFIAAQFMKHTKHSRFAQREDGAHELEEASQARVMSSSRRARA